jgi:hypothetical protein
MIHAFTAQSVLVIFRISAPSYCQWSNIVTGEAILCGLRMEVSAHLFWTFQSLFAFSQGLSVRAFGIPAGISAQWTGASGFGVGHLAHNPLYVCLRFYAVRLMNQGSQPLPCLGLCLLLRCSTARHLQSLIHSSLSFTVSDGLRYIVMRIPTYRPPHASMNLSEALPFSRRCSCCNLCYRMLFNIVPVIEIAG